MSKRPTDHLQPAGKRRPGDQLTKDNADDDDDEETGVDPGTWGKADHATMSRRKVVRVRRGGAAAEPAPAEAAAEPAPAAAGSNPFAGVSLTSADPAAANPFAGVSLLAAAKPPEPAKEAVAGPTDNGNAAAALAEAAEKKAAADAGTKPAEEQPADKHAEQAAPDAKEPAAAVDQPSDDKAAPAAPDRPADAAKVEAAPAAASTSLFGGSTGGFGAATGGFGGLGSGTGFGGGFGGFAAAAKDGSSGGSLFGSYTAPQPGSLFAPVPAFGAPRQSRDGEAAEGQAEGEGADGDGEGDAVFGGNDIAPVVQLSEVPKQTGEEEEEVLFAADGSLFEFVGGKEWKERGKGELRVNINKATQQARLVMRNRGSQKLLLNANLHPKMTTSKMVGGKGVTFAAVNAAVGSGAGETAGQEHGKEKEVKEAAAAAEAGSSKEGGSPDAAGAASNASVMRTYALKVKSAEKIDAFVTTVDSYKTGVPREAAAAAGAAGADNWV